MRTILITITAVAAAAGVAGVARADRPTKATAKQAAGSWVKELDAGGTNLDRLTAPDLAVHATGCAADTESSTIVGQQVCFAREELSWAPKLAAVSATGAPRTLRKFKRELVAAAKDHVLIAGKVRADMESIDYVITIAAGEDGIARVDGLYYAFKQVTEND